MTGSSGPAAGVGRVGGRSVKGGEGDSSRGSSATKRESTGGGGEGGEETGLEVVGLGMGGWVDSSGVGGMTWTLALAFASSSLAVSFDPGIGWETSTSAPRTFSTCPFSSCGASDSSTGRSETTTAGDEPGEEGGGVGPNLSIPSSPAGGPTESFFGRWWCVPLGSSGVKAPTEEEGNVGDVPVDEAFDEMEADRPPTLAPSSRSSSCDTLRSVTGLFRPPLVSARQSRTPSLGEPVSLASSSGGARVCPQGPELTRLETLTDRSSTRSLSSRSREDLSCRSVGEGPWNLARRAATPPDEGEPMADLDEDDALLFEGEQARRGKGVFSSLLDDPLYTMSRER